MLKIAQKNQFKIILAVLLFGLAYFSLNASVSAAITNPVIGEMGREGSDVSSGSRFIEYAVYLWRASITIGSLAVILFFLLGAFGWITAGGEKGKIEEARNKMTNAVIGLVLLVSSFVLLGFMSRLLFGDNFNILKLTIPGIGGSETQVRNNNYQNETRSDPGFRVPSYNENAGTQNIMR